LVFETGASKLQGCIFWPFSPPWRGGEKEALFGVWGRK